MYLCETLVQGEATYPMVGALPLTVEQMKTPQGHGYVRSMVDKSNPFIEPGIELRGHEFHYSRLRGRLDEAATVMSLTRGTGLGDKRDGILHGNVVASYTHFHALGAPEWAAGLVDAAAREAA